jgi:hypothetical protein
MHYGPVYRQQRLAFHRMLQPRGFYPLTSPLCSLTKVPVVGNYERMQVEESTKLLYDMMTRPKEMHLNTKRYSASLVFRMSYGRRLSEDDADLKEVLEILDGFIEDCYPGTHLVDTFPMLDSQFIPDWIARWREEARLKHEREIKVRSNSQSNHRVY